MHGKTVCYHHGGRTPRGLALPQTTHGRYSKSMPTRLLAEFEQAKRDPELLSLRENIALIDARLSELLGRADTGESGENWKSLGETMHALRRARDEEERAQAIDAIEALVQAGQSDYAAWRGILDLHEQRRKCTESEQKRLVAMQQMMSGEQATLLIGQILHIIKRNVTDRTVLAAVARDIDLLAVARPGE